MKPVFKAKKPDYLHINYIKEGNNIKFTARFIFSSSNILIYQVVQNEDGILTGYGYEELEGLPKDGVDEFNGKVTVNKYFKYKKRLGLHDNISAAMKSSDYIPVELIKKNLKKGGAV